MPTSKYVLRYLVPNALPYILRILAVRQPNRKKVPLVGDDVPTIDILITCCNENINVVMDTVRAASVLDYPPAQYRVFVCDDGASAELQQEVLALSCIYANVHYTARVKGAVKDYKAGNLNHGLLFSSQVCRAMPNYQDLKRPPLALSVETTSTPTLSFHRSIDAVSLNDSRSSTRTDLIEKSTFASPASTMSEYVAGLDADMIPEPHWLRTILPHLIDDPKVAMGCPPQVSTRFVRPLLLRTVATDNSTRHSTTSRSTTHSLKPCLISPASQKSSTTLSDTPTVLAQAMS